MLPRVTQKSHLRVLQVNSPGVFPTCGGESDGVDRILLLLTIWVATTTRPLLVHPFLDLALASFAGRALLTNSAFDVRDLGAMSAVGLGTPPVNGHKYDSEHNARPSSAMNNYEDDDDLEFESPKEEADFYRDKYRVAIDLLNETRAELGGFGVLFIELTRADEFQVSSRELEQELENELEVTEARQAELRDRANRLETEKEEWKVRE